MNLCRLIGEGGYLKVGCGDQRLFLAAGRWEIGESLEEDVLFSFSGAGAMASGFSEDLFIPLQVG